jgi:hypothetical protein
MSSLSDRLGQLRQRAASIAAELTSLADKRRGYSLAATEADSKAVKAISDIDVQMDSLKREETTVRSAEEVATALQQHEHDEAQAKEQHEREVAAHNTASAIGALQSEIDARLVELRQCFERRAAMVQELSNTRLVDLSLLSKLSSKSPATRACCHHGLDRFIAIERTSVQGRMPLADANVLLAGIGKAPDPDKLKIGRMKLQ